MTVTPPENNDPTNNGQGEVNDPPKIHPAHQEILDALPESLHPVIIPKLKEWDLGVQKKINDLHATYDPYKNFIENNVPADYLEQAAVLLDSFNENPEEVVAKAVEHYKLDWAQKAELERQLKEAQASNSSDPDDPDDLVDLEEDERFKEVQKTTRELAEWRRQQEEERQAAKEQEEYNNLMENLHKNHGEFDDTIVTALMASGMNGEQAVKRYEELVNQAAANIANKENEPPNPPVVLGGNGASGSGVPAGDISFGKMKPSDLTKTVAGLLAANADKS